MSRLVLPRHLAGLSLLAATALLAGCVSTYGYRSGDGDYYYADPQVEYYGYGPYGSVVLGGWYGGAGIHYRGYPGYYGGYPYGTYRYRGFPYGGYGFYDPYYHYGQRPPRHRPPGHHVPPPQYPPGQRPPGQEPPGNENRGPVAWRGSQPRLPPRDVRQAEPQVRPAAPSRPVAPARQAPLPPPPAPRPARAERQVRDLDHAP